MDSLIEIYSGHSPFNYTVNKLIKFIYPECKSVAIDREITSYAGLDAQYDFKGLQMRFGNFNTPGALERTVFFKFIASEHHVVLKPF